MSKLRKIVITGGPCSGKTSTINQFSKLGYTIVHEAALQLIRQEDHGAKDVFPWTDFARFQTRVVKLQIELESKIPHTTDIALLDRSLLDVVAYYNAVNQRVPKKVCRSIVKAEYQDAFYLELLPSSFRALTENEKPRMLAEADARRVGEEILRVYQACLANVTIVPFMSLSEHVEFIKSRLYA